MRPIRAILFLFLVGGSVAPASTLATADPFEPTGFGFAGSPWRAAGGQAYASFGHSVGSAGDVNGDGYADVIVGDPHYNGAEGWEGRAYVYHGSATGLSRSPDWIAGSDEEGAFFGWSVGTAGDVNADGYSDVIVGAIGHGDLSQGSAFIYLGSASGLGSAPSWTTSGDEDTQWVGYSVGTAGDVNADGYADVIVGAPYDDFNQGAAFGFHGSASGPSAIPDWTVENDRSGLFGSSVGTAGDVNGDGYADAVVGVPYYSNGQDTEGRALVYHGSADGLSSTANWTEESDEAISLFGASVGTGGDVNGDGYADLVVGANQYDGDQISEGRAYAYLGSAVGLVSTPAWTVEGNLNYASLGFSVGAAGDVNGDGYSDLIVGAVGLYHGERGEGATFVYLGSNGGPSVDADRRMEGDQEYAALGFSVARAGDVDGDGHDEIIVGAPGGSGHRYSEGLAFVVRGRA
jgi:hypothetical protein